MLKATTILSAMFIAIGGFLFGYELGIVSSTLAQPHFIATFGNLSDAVIGGIVSCYTGGAIIGTLFVSLINDRFGRKKAIFFGAGIGTFGCALQAGSTSLGMLIAGRILAGFSIGILTSTIPMYCAEIAPAEHRGALAGLLQWMLSWGFLVAQWMGYGCNFVDSAFQWRFPIAFQCVPAGILFCGALFLDESPRWLVDKERFEEAHKSIRSLHGNGQNQDFLDQELEDIKVSVMLERQANATTWKFFFTNPVARKKLLLGCGVQFFTQTSGLNVVAYYGPRIYATLGIDVNTSLKIIGISGCLAVVYTSIALYFLDKVGRIKPLIVGAFGCGSALLVTAVLSQYYAPGPGANQSALRAQVAMNFVLNFFFVALGVVSWVYPSEIFPTELRAKGNSATTFVNWATGLFFAQISPIALGNIGFKYFYVFFVFDMIATLCFAFFYPETKGITLEAMDALFGGEICQPSTVEHVEKTSAEDMKRV
ncbi:hypothetical protein ACLOAV_010839 [Pseudogymnoascus australis]